MSRALVVFCFVLFAGYVAGNLIRKDDVNTKDVKIAHNDDTNTVLDVNTKEVPDILVNVEKTDMEMQQPETPAIVFGSDAPKKCAEIGQFCTFHGECCTNACLGYLKKCVSGSG